VGGGGGGGGLLVLGQKGGGPPGGRGFLSIHRGVGKKKALEHPFFSKRVEGGKNKHKKKQTNKTKTKRAHKTPPQPGLLRGAIMGRGGGGNGESRGPKQNQKK